MALSRTRRFGATIIAGSVLAAHLLAGSAVAGNTRLIYVGPGPVTDLTTNGHLTLTPVTVGGTTATTVIVKNIDNQNLSHVVLSFIAPASGLTLSGWFPNLSECRPTSTRPLSCDFGNLAAGAMRTLTVTYMGTAAGEAGISAAVTFNETRPNTGSNTHIEPIDGVVTVTNGGCDTVQTFFAPSNLDNATGTLCALTTNNPQQTFVKVPGSIVSAIKVAEVNSSLCDPSVTCFGQTSIADVDVDGDYTVVWTLVWKVAGNFNASKLGILHFPDGSTTPDLKITVKRNICKTPEQTGCIESFSLVGTTLTAVLRTKGNGSAKGWL
ncbi:MAG: hypothetical protein ACJ761_09315 [Chloroflexota bacterium]